MTMTSKTTTGQEDNPFEVFGITSDQPEIMPLQTRVQTTNPIAPPPGFGGLWGDLDTATGLSDVTLPREPGELFRKPSGTRIGNRVREYVRKARPSSRATTPETSLELSSPNSPTQLLRGNPRSKAQCLTGFIFPLLKPPSRITNMYGPDAIAAFMQLEGCTLQVQYHAGLAPLLLRQLETLRGIPTVPHVDSPGGFSRADAMAAEEYARSLDSWMRAEAKMADFASKHRKSDLEVAVKWGYYLGRAVNNLIKEDDTFRAGWRPRRVCSWQLPHTVDAEHRSHDWLAWSDSEDIPRAMLSWRMDASAADFDALYTAAVSRVPPNWVLDANYPGLEIDVHDGHITSPQDVTWNASLLALLTWHGMHHYRIRWAIVFNGDTAVITYLAKHNTMFMSKPFGREGDDGLTLASAMFALATMNHENDANRPLCTMRNGSIGFHPRIAARDVRDNWADLCAHADWAARDFPLYLARVDHSVKEEPATKEGPESEQEREFPSPKQAVASTSDHLKSGPACISPRRVIGNCIA